MGLQEKIMTGLQSNKDVGFIRAELLVTGIGGDLTPWQATAVYVSPQKEEKRREEKLYSVEQPGYWGQVGGGSGRRGTPVWRQPLPEVHSAGYITVFNKLLDQHLNELMAGMLPSIGEEPAIATECSIRPTSKGGYFTIGGYCFREPIAVEQVNREIQINDPTLLSVLLKQGRVQGSGRTIKDMTEIVHYNNIFVFPMPTKQFLDHVAEEPLGYLGILYGKGGDTKRGDQIIMNRIKKIIDQQCVGRTYSFPDHIQRYA